MTTIARWGQVASALAVALATATGVASLAQAPAAGRKPEAVRVGELPTVEVKPGKFRVVVVERGVLEATHTTDILNQVEGNTTIISLLPEGSRVKKGDHVGELDSALLRDHLMNQQITAAQAEANYQNAKLSREVAEIALREYAEGTFKQEDEALRGTIALARSAIQKANTRLERTRRRGNGWTTHSPRGKVR